MNILGYLKKKASYSDKILSKWRRKNPNIFFTKNWIYDINARSF